MIINPFAGEGNWYRGCLHCHTTISRDGMYTPEELKELYKENGYSFLALTDHDKFTWHHGMSDESFLVWPGSEVSVNCSDPTLTPLEQSKFHTCFLYDGTVEPSACFEDMEKTNLVVENKDEYLEKIQEHLDLAAKRGCIATVNHPMLFGLQAQTLMNLEGWFGVEIYNSGVENMEANDYGPCVLLWDELLRHGKRVWALASDDTHGRDSTTVPPSKVPVDSARFDGLRAWVEVYAKSLSIQDLRDALLAGRFYSSTGPKLQSFYVEGNVVKVTCSPVEKIRFVTYESRGRVEYGPKKGDLITEAKYVLSGTENFVRVECVDQYGKTAWSNPIFLQD